MSVKVIVRDLPDRSQYSHWMNFQYLPHQYLVIREGKRDGKLRWKFCGRHPDMAIVLPVPKPQNLNRTVVTREQSEALTGLSYPASFDRLREMVQDPEEWVLPDQNLKL